MGRPMEQDFPKEGQKDGAPTPPGEGEPVRLPDLCGDLAMRIDRNGTWYYRGSPIGRLALVKLFSTVLRRDADGVHWLTTPVENGRIDVEDAPFIAVEMTAEGVGKDQVIRFRTNVDDMVTLDGAHALRIDESESGEPRPYIHVRKGLEARINRPVFYHLIARGEPDPANAARFGVWSSGQFFALGALA